MKVAVDNEAQYLLKLTGIEQQADGIAVTWSDNQQSFFHYLWLRDCCYCEVCGDSYSSKRYFLPNDIALDIVAEQVEIDADGNLKILWAPDQHLSHFDAQWLSRYRYDHSAHQARFHQPSLWRADLVDNLPRIDFQQAANDEVRLFELYRNLRDFGFVIVVNGSAEPGSVEVVAGLIGEMAESAYSRIFDLSPASSVNTLGNTFHSVPPHTDEAFRHNAPGINILGCVRPASEGGESLLVDGFQIAEQLRQSNREGFNLLVNYGQSFNRIHPGSLDQRSRQPMISLDDRGQVIRVRIHTRAAAPLDLPADILKPYYGAYRELCALMMDPENQVRFQLQAGDSVLFDNHRVLHSRTEFTDARRFLQICNVSREGFHEKLRLLASKLGHVDEADMILAA